MVISTVSNHEDARYQYRPQRSAQTTAIYLKPSTSSGVRSTTATMRCSPQKSPLLQKQQKVHIAVPRSEQGIMTGTPTMKPQNTSLDAGQDGGKQANTTSMKVGVKGHMQMNHGTSDSSLSSSHVTYHLQNGSKETYTLPITAPLNSPCDDTSKKRRRRSSNLNHWHNASLQQRAIFCAILIFSLWQAVRLTQRIHRKFQGEQLPPPQTLDFLVAGFPKAGTTTMLATLRDHPQIAMDSQENCEIARPIQQDDVNLKRLNRYLFALKNDVVKERNQDRSLLFSLSSMMNNGANPALAPLVPENLMSGIKCPDAVKNFKAIHRLSQHSPNCKLIIGVRHPILFLQSFYNYRVLEAHVKNRPDIPSLFDIWERKLNWWDISPDTTRYELFLSQFGKTEMSLDQLQNWFVERPTLAVKPNRFRIFLYTLEQMEDVSNNDTFRRDLQNFLGLSEEVQHFGHENKISSLADQYKETIDICSAEYSSLRSVAIQNAVTTVQWMRKFLQSPDVVVSNRAVVEKQIETWTRDPCEDASVSAA